MREEKKRLQVDKSELFDMAVEVELIVLYKIREGESGRRNSHTTAAQALSWVNGWRSA